MPGEGPYTRYPRTTLWLLEGDEFTMGEAEAGHDRGPAFVAEVRSLYIGKSVITNEQYEVYDPDHARASSSSGDDDPVVNVDFRDAVGYCEWYSKASGKPFRLPSEIEWEFACRSMTTTPAFWGERLAAADRHAWHAGNSDGRCHPTESTEANPFGLHDMLGLVWEWTGSLYRPYPAAPDDGRESLEARGARAVRGGSFRTDPAQLGSAVRLALAEDVGRDDLGFRIVRSL